MRTLNNSTNPHYHHHQEQQQQHVNIPILKASRPISPSTSSSLLHEEQQQRQRQRQRSRRRTRKHDLQTTQNISNHTTIITSWRRRIRQVLLSRRVISLVNLTVLILLLIQLILMLHSSLSTSRNIEIKKNMLPFPLLLSPLFNSEISSHVQNPSPYAGYATVRRATFRSRYPSTDMAHKGTFDGVFILYHSQCHAHVTQLERELERLGLELPHTLVDVSTSLSNSYMSIQKQIWQYIIIHKLQRCLVLHDQFFFTPYAVHHLPHILSLVDIQSVVNHVPWHVILLNQLHSHHHFHHHHLHGGPAEERVYTVNHLHKNTLKVTYTNASYTEDGVSLNLDAYVISYQGAMFLNSKIPTDSSKTTIATSLDIQLSLLHQQYPNNLTTLSICQMKKDGHCHDILQRFSSPLSSYPNEDVCDWKKTLV